MLSPHEYEELLYAAQNKEVPRKNIKSRSVVRTGGSPPTPLCNTCRRKAEPTWHGPIAVCSACERTEPCLHARSDRPICRACAQKHPSRLETCAFCGTPAIVKARTRAGSECGACGSRRMRSKIRCARCRRQTRPSAAEARLCERCAGARVQQVCRGCGAEQHEDADTHGDQRPPLLRHAASPSRLAGASLYRIACASPSYGGADRGRVMERSDRQERMPSRAHLRPTVRARLRPDA
jgi:hypothetical protein